MKLPIAMDAYRFAGPLAALAAIAWLWLGVWASLPFLAMMAVVLWFFRDPKRTPPHNPRAIVAAADGKITDIDPGWQGDDLMPAGTRIGVFLSVLNVHINRAPLDGEVESIHHRPGKFLNALKAESAIENESNLIRFRRGSLIFGVKQISGAIARRIVCSCRPGLQVGHAERIGLIRFGSRTEHYLPPGIDVCVRVGDRVRGGETILGHLPADSPGGAETE